MKFMFEKYKKFKEDVSKIRIVIPVDAYDIDPNFPLIKPLISDDIYVLWDVIVDLETGFIENWPKGEFRDLFVKVVDSGSYYLLDENNNVVAAIEENYVPNKCIPPLDGYGDYIDLQIDENGRITNWYTDFDFSEFLNEEEY